MIANPNRKLSCLTASRFNRDTQFFVQQRSHPGSAGRVRRSNDAVTNDDLFHMVSIPAVQPGRFADALWYCQFVMKAILLAIVASAVLGQIPKNDPNGVWQAETGSKVGSRFTMKLNGSDLDVTIVPKSNPRYIDYHVALKVQEEDPNTYKGTGYFVAKMETGKECKFETDWQLTVVQSAKILGSTTSVVADSTTCEIKDKTLVRLDLTKVE